MLMVHLAQYTAVVAVVFGWHLVKGHGSKMHVMLPPRPLSLFPTPLERDSKGEHGHVPSDTGDHAKI